MLKYSSRNIPEYLTLPALFLTGLLVLGIRNPDPFVNLILYTEDGAWLGLAFSKGWLYALFNAKDSYLVLGNIILLWIAETSSKILCGNSLVCLPQSIGIVSIAFYSCVATFSFAATREVASFTVRLLLFCVLLLLPLGDSSNEIIGRLSNVGFMFVLLSVLLVSYRERLKITTSVYIIDVFLIISAATNPVVTIFITIYASWRFYRARGREWRNDLILLLGICLVATLTAYRMSSQLHSESTGVLDPVNLVEVGIARAILYPLIFPYYTSLTNFSTIAIFLSWVFFVILAIWRSGDQSRVFIAYNLVALIIFLTVTLVMRQGLTQQLNGYSHTFPDRYFMGINAIVMVVTLVVASSLLDDSKIIIKAGGGLLLTALIILYVNRAPWIFETNKTRMPLMSGVSFPEHLCERGNTLTKSTAGLVNVPIYFEGWSISIPSPMLLAATPKLDCQALRPLSISDENWNHGVARTWSGLVLGSYVSPRLLQVGRTVRFANGEIRVINRMDVGGRYINVFFDGMPLDGKLVGYPNKFEVME